MSVFEIKPLGPIGFTTRFRIGPAEMCQRYLAIAMNLAAGLQPLTADTNISAVPLAFLAGQVTETAPKAFLLKHILSRELRKEPVRHNIGKLWAMARQHGLQIVATPPDPIQVLDRLHSHPFPLRYSSDEELVHLIALPDRAQLCAEV